MLPLIRSRSRALAIALTMLVVLGCVFVLVGLERERHTLQRAQAVQARLSAHHLMEQSERLPAMERLERIRAELVSGDMPEWAGEYEIKPEADLRMMCAHDPLRVHREGFALAPHSGAVWWYGDENLPDSRCIDHGDILRVDGSSISIAWILNGGSAHSDVYVPWPLLDAEIVRLGTGEDAGLMPASRMPLLCAAVSEGGTVMAARAPRKNRVRGSDARGPIVVPEEWQEYVLAQPLRAPCQVDAAHSSPPRWSWGRFPPWRKPTNKELEETLFVAFVECSIPLGTRDGLREGMPMYLSERVSIPGRIVELDSTSARIEFMTYPAPSSEAEFYSGEQVSTRPVDRD